MISNTILFSKMQKFIKLVLQICLHLYGPRRRRVALAYYSIVGVSISAAFQLSIVASTEGL